MLNKITKANNQKRQAILKAVRINQVQTVQTPVRMPPSTKLDNLKQMKVTTDLFYRDQCQQMQENAGMMIATRRNFSMFQQPKNDKDGKNSGEYESGFDDLLN